MTKKLPGMYTSKLLVVFMVLGLFIMVLLYSMQSGEFPSLKILEPYESVLFVIGISLLFICLLEEVVRASGPYEGPKYYGPKLERIYRIKSKETGKWIGKKGKEVASPKNAKIYTEAQKVIEACKALDKYHGKKYAQAVVSWLDKEVDYHIIN